MIDRNMPPHVDVVIAGWNEAKHLGSCLRSIRAQQYPAERIHLWFVDDGSADATREIAAREGATVLVADGKGQGPARNKGIQAGSAELIAFFDAHCDLDPDWLARMTAEFQTRDVGGCVSRIVHVADDPRVQAMIDASRDSFEDYWLDDTVYGKRNLYPWVVSANCVFRRCVLDAIGGFAEDLWACEDVELSWRVVTAGYRLTYVPDVKVVHHETRPYRGYLAKGLRYGRGSAEVAAMYRDHGASESLCAGRVVGRSFADTISRLNFIAGHRTGNLRMRFLAGARRTAVPIADVRSVLRPWAPWTAERELRIAPSIVFWYIPRDDAAIVVRARDRSRFVLEDAACAMWRFVADGTDRDVAVRALASHYGIDGTASANDLDEFVDDLLSVGVLESRVQARSEIGGISRRMDERL